MDQAKAAGAEPLQGLLAGLAAGLLASFAMTKFQGAVAKLSGSDDDGGDEDDGDPATAKAADKVSQAVTGEPVRDEHKGIAGEAVHYAFGAVLGTAYGLAAEYRPAVTVGYGAGFAVVTASLFDEIAVPAAGLSGPPWKSPPVTHLYSYASHLAFGLTCEAVRRVLRRNPTFASRRR